MDKKQIVKAVLMFGGAFLIFVLLKPKFSEKENSSGQKKSADGEKDIYPAPTAENAEIVAIAYTDALKNGEPAARLTELNKEMMKEFGMRCYIDQKTGKTVVCDVKGDTILEK